ncbi:MULTISPECIES: hypothetical protein [Pseudomonas syringae group]|uniref:hypothetical protein n=1 Tax=Pseudomonas syringae group TaxID=136849 RepID=UPI0006D5F656|nr:MULTISPECIES: hypothetical protein [Pseudomonas syringae group]KPZ27069.1 Uncharacterized protein ALO38_04132 [Pseudomonas coronafaciens pv. zizaniae]MCF5805331.1 hypothetical protein [Pseudomonas tremae]MCF5810249.1 hypothetical protein [Pseudomonas tremae]
MPFMDVKIDLTKDYIDLMYERLKLAGWHGSREDRDIELRYANFLRRNVTSQKRKVYISKYLQCPKEYETPYNLILQKILIGELISPHLSRNLKKPDYSDLFLNDWGIHHLHLSTEIEKDGFCKRTEFVLLVIFEKDFALVIDIRPHGSENPTLWVQKNILDIVLCSWPEWISRFRLRGLGASRNITEQEHLNLRKSRLNTQIKLSDGNTYMGPGGGITTAGTSVQATMRSDQIFHMLRKFEEEIRNDISLYKKRFWGEMCEWPFFIAIKLYCIGENFYIVAHGSGTALSIHTPWPTEMDEAARCHMRVIAKLASVPHIQKSFSAINGRHVD